MRIDALHFMRQRCYIECESHLACQGLSAPPLFEAIFRLIFYISLIFHYIDEDESISIPCTCDMFMHCLAIPVSLVQWYLVLQSEQFQRSERTLVRISRT